MAVVLLSLVVGALCLWGGMRRPAVGRLVATAFTGTLAVAAVVLAIVFFVQAGSPDQKGTFGETALGLVGSVILVGGFVLAGLTAVIHFGEEAGRWIGVAVLGAVGWYAAQVTIETEETATLIIAGLVGPVGVAGAALLAGGSGAVRRWLSPPPAGGPS